MKGECSTVNCAYGELGQTSIEWYTHDGIAQRYCYGWIDDYTDELLEVCFKCPNHVFHAQRDFEKYEREETI